MDLGVEILFALLLLATMMKGAVKGYPFPAYFVAILASVVALYLRGNQEPQEQISVAWWLTSAAIVTALLARSVQSNRQ